MENNFKVFTLVADSNDRLYLLLKSKLSHKFYRYLKSSSALFFVNNTKVNICDYVLKNSIITIKYLEKVSSISWPLDNTPVNILYKDLNYLVCYKPSNLLTIPTKVDPNSIYQRLCFSLGFNSFKLLNRLDKQTSGLLLIALDRYSADILNPICDTVFRSYYAIVYGNILDQEINVNIIKSSDSNKRIISNDGLLAKTIVSVIAKRNNFSFIQLQLITGRTHQIRVSLASIGVYILGDTLYSDNKYSYPFMCLESSRIKFVNNLNHNVIDIKSSKLWEVFCEMEEIRPIR